MSRSTSLLSLSFRRALIPVLGMALLPLPLTAGNQSGPGWQQSKPKAKATKSNPLPASRPAAVPVPALDPVLPSGSAIPVAPQRTAPEEGSIQRSVPGTGPLGEDEIIRLAIANNAELARRRSEILIARAKAKGAGDWENPELRIGYAWNQDDRLSEPFTEQATERITAGESYSSLDRQRNLAPEFFPGYGESSLQRTSGSVNTSRYRTIERKVTPGQFRDVVETTVYEQRKASGTSLQSNADTIQGVTADRREARSQQTNRRIVERSREVINHPDDYSRDDEFALLIRFRIPNPWERKAKLEIAAAETARAESDYLIEEDKVVRTVRAMYEDLNMAESVARSTGARRALNEKFRDEIDATNLPGLADLGADIRLGVGKTIREQREFRSDIARLRQELATLCGLPHPERISVIGKPTRRLVSLESLDVDYLIRMAQLHRSDLLDLKARLALAKAELMGAKAAKIPFFTFVDGGWATSQTSGRTGENEEWAVRAGISLPLFDWFGINKAHLEHETASTAYSQQIEEQSRLIATDIRQAIDRIRAASKELSVYESDLAAIKADSRKSIEQTSVDPIRSLKTRYQTEELVFKFEEDRYEVWSDYYKAVMELERALGTRLERVLSR
jgi:outer membrane protein TolC